MARNGLRSQVRAFHTQIDIEKKLNKCKFKFFCSNFETYFNLLRFKIRLFENYIGRYTVKILNKISIIDFSSIMISYFIEFHRIHISL